MENISNKMAKGAAWMALSKIIERGIGLLNTLILVRLLEPSDFGLFSMAMAFLGLLTLLTSFSFDYALIQKQNADRHLYDTAWTFNVIFGFFLALLLVCSAIPIAQYYNEPRLTYILYILAINCLLGGFSNIGPVAFRKDLEFHKEFYYSVSKRFIGFIVCIALAFILRNYLALFWSLVIGRVLEVLLSYIIHPYRPRFDLSSRKELFSFSIWMFINNSIFFAYHRSADFIITKLLGVHSQGIYSVSYELSNMPTTELVAPINRAILPGYSKMANDLTALKQGFLNVLSMIALCAIPAGVGIALVADNLVIAVLGENWREAIPLIQILAFSGIITALQSNTGYVLIALDKPKYVTIIFCCHLLLFFLPLLVILLKEHGLQGVAEAYLLSNIIIIPFHFVTTCHLLHLKPLPIFSVLWRPVLGSCLMSAAVVYTSNYITELLSLNTYILKLIFTIIQGAAVYITSILILWCLARLPEGAESFLLRKIKFNPKRKTLAD